ncbi:hypothetical protein GCM10010519_76860 [Streptomyces lactacystinicus]
MRQKTPLQLRADAEESLRDPGERRIRLLAELRELEAELRPLIQAAREVELPLRRIEELTGVTPNTIRSWTK